VNECKTLAPTGASPSFPWYLSFSIFALLSPDHSIDGGQDESLMPPCTRGIVSLSLWDHFIGCRLWHYGSGSELRRETVSGLAPGGGGSGGGGGGGIVLQGVAAHVEIESNAQKRFITFQFQALKPGVLSTRV